MAQTPSDYQPGANALIAMKNISNAVATFKVPRAPSHYPKQQQNSKNEKMTILCEEQYVEELGKIIEKDFFPDLEKLRAQNQYLDAVERNDMIKLRELHAKYSGNRPSPRSGSKCSELSSFNSQYL